MGSWLGSVLNASILDIAVLGSSQNRASVPVALSGVVMVAVAGLVGWLTIAGACLNMFAGCTLLVTTYVGAGGSRSSCQVGCLCFRWLEGAPVAMKL